MNIVFQILTLANGAIALFCATLGLAIGGAAAGGMGAVTSFTISMFSTVLLTIFALLSEW